MYPGMVHRAVPAVYMQVTLGKRLGNIALSFG